jgi:Uma2 family endonuclease
MPPAAEAPPQSGLTWEEVCADPLLQNLPYKIETNRWGQIVMSPTCQKHGAFQSEIGYLLRTHLPTGRVVSECAVRTAGGVKVADVAWYSPERWAEVKEAFDAPVAPEVCVEVRSPRNAPGEIEQKRRLYFAAGAEEVWVCEEDGRVRFYDRNGERERSARVAGFPDRVSI